MPRRAPEPALDLVGATEGVLGVYEGADLVRPVPKPADSSGVESGGMGEPCTAPSEPPVNHSTPEELSPPPDWLSADMHAIEGALAAAKGDLQIMVDERDRQVAERKAALDEVLAQVDRRFPLAGKNPPRDANPLEVDHQRHLHSAAKKQAREQHNRDWPEPLAPSFSVAQAVSLLTRHAHEVRSLVKIYGRAIDDYIAAAEKRKTELDAGAERRAARLVAAKREAAKALLEKVRQEKAALAELEELGVDR